MILGVKLLLGSDITGACNLVIETLGKMGRIPREMVFGSWLLFEALRRALEPLGIRCVYDVRIPLIDAVAEESAGFSMSSGGRPKRRRAPFGE